MTQKRGCYQCGDDGRTLDEIREARNAEIRAWGKRVLEEADAALKGETVLTPKPSDWDQVETQEIPQIQEVQETPDIETVEPDVLAATEPQEGEANANPEPETDEEPAKEEPKTETKAAPKRASRSKEAPSKD